MKMDLSRTGRVLLTIGLFAGFGALAFNPRFYITDLLYVYIALVLLSTVIIHLRARPKWSEVLLILCGAAFIAGVDYGALGLPPGLWAGFSFLGISSLVVMGTRAIWEKEPDRKFMLCAFVPAFLLVGSYYIANPLLKLTEAAHPKVLDVYLYSFECSMGVQLSFLMGLAFVKWIWFKLIALFFYVGLPIPLAMVFAGQLVRKKEGALPVMVAFLLTGPIGVLFYNVYPALGPAHLFHGDFPFHPLPFAQAPHLMLEAVSIPGPRNAIPSLHTAWVLLAWWYSRGLSRLERGIALTFVVFTLIATLGTGEHYFVDLVVVFPFALLILALCAFSLSWKNKQRVAGCLYGALGTLAWLGLLRYGIRLFWLSPVIPWAAMAATIAFSWMQIYRLQQAEDLTEEKEIVEPPVDAVPVEVS